MLRLKKSVVTITTQQICYREIGSNSRLHINPDTSTRNTIIDSKQHVVGRRSYGLTYGAYCTNTIGISSIDGCWSCDRQLDLPLSLWIRMGCEGSAWKSKPNVACRSCSKTNFHSECRIVSDNLWSCGDLRTHRIIDRIQIFRWESFHSKLSWKLTSECVC